MKPRRSNSLLLVWRIAELEAKHLNAIEIQPVHVLIGLAKAVDLDLPALVSKGTADRDAILEELLREVRRLRTIFSTAQVKPSALRRKLRGSPIYQRFHIPKSETLHRSASTRKVFADAEHFAQLTGSIVYPAHLLYAVLLPSDERCDNVLQTLQIDKKRLLEIARREVVLQREAEIGPAPNPKTRWN